jgi:spore maturation protein CgeB
VTESFDIVILGLSVTSSWGNGHATTYRGLIRGLAGRGHRVLFLERDAPWYAENRDEPHPRGAVTELYRSFDELVTRFEKLVSEARLVIVGSFVREGTRVGEWVTSVARGRTAFYDIDTPVTLAQLANGEREHISPSLIPRYNAYLSFTGGPALSVLENHYGSPMARVLFCSIDPEKYRPLQQSTNWDLGYLGTYSEDRQPGLESLILAPARQLPQGPFTVAGPMYPDSIVWPANVEREIHLSPGEHAGFYSSQRFSLNITRAEMKRAGFSPSVRLFEAGACAVPVISDWWKGLDQLFSIGDEVLISEGAEDTLRYLRDISDGRRLAIGQAARERILAEHTPEHRAMQLEGYLKEIDDNASAYTARRNGRPREVNHGFSSGLASQQYGESPGRSAGAEVGSLANRGDLHQPIGTSGRNGGADRQPSSSRATPPE